MKKRVISLLLVGAIALISGCNKQEQTTTAQTPVTLNEVAHSIFYAPQYVAIENGYFAEEGIDLTLVTGFGADKVATALVSGEADIGFMGSESSIYIYNQNPEDYIVNFAQLTQRAGNFLVSREPEPNFKWSDVKGKSIIGGRIGGMPELVLEYVLKQNGITPNVDMELINNIAYTSTSGAFVGDIGDYTVEFEPTATALQQQGSGYIVASLGTASGYVPYTVYMATSDYIQQNPEVIQKFTNAIQKGQTWVKEHTPEQIAQVILPQFPDTDIETLTTIIERYKQQDTWKENTLFDEDGFTLIQDIMEQGGELSARIPYKDMIVTEFSENAMK